MSKGSAQSLARSSAVMASGTMVSRLLGVVRMALLAAAIGNQTPAANVWETANTLPNTIYLLLAAGVLNVLLLPQLTRAMTRGEQGQDYIDRLLTLAITIIGVGTLLFLLAAPLVTKFYALSWPWGGPMLNLAILFAYLCIPQILFYGLHTLLGQILAAHHRFAAFMWSPALANVVAIGGILIFLRRYPGAGAIPLPEWTGGMIWLLAGSATLGIVLQAVVLIPAVRSTGFRYRPRWGFRGVGLRIAGVMALWALADVGVSQGGLWVVSNLLNWVAEVEPTAPARAAYNYAFSTFILPHSLIALSLLTAIYPLLSKAAARGDRRAMSEHTQQGLRMLGLAMIPISVGMILITPLVLRVIFPTDNVDHGALTPIVIALCMGLVPYGVYLLCSRVFYSFEDARTPFFFQLSITGVLLVVVLFAFTQSPWRAAILVGMGQALGQGTAAVLGLRAVRKRLPWVGLRAIGADYLRMAGAAAVALLPTWGIIALLDRPGSVSALITLAVAGPLYLVVYALLAHFLGIVEVAQTLAPVWRRIPGLSTRGPGSSSSGPGLSVAPGVNQEVAEMESATPPPASPILGYDEGTLGWDEVWADHDPDGSGEDGMMQRLEVGTRLGDRYALEELLARRDEGTLDYWSARDVTLGRLVAVTVLPAADEYQASAQAVVDAARRVASVDDPRLVRVLDVGIEEGLCWIVEEGLTEAESLASLTRAQPLPPEEARRIIGESAAGLEAARRRGLHHLFLNPHSILRTGDGAVKISGVGVTAAIEDVDDIADDEASLIDAADLVALLYTTLTGQWPGEPLAGVHEARRLSDDSVPAPSELVAGIPGDLDALCRVVLGPQEQALEQAAPHTPGELAHQLSPWPAELVSGTESSQTSAHSAYGASSAGASLAHHGPSEHLSGDLTDRVSSDADDDSADVATGDDPDAADDTGVMSRLLGTSSAVATSGSATSQHGAGMRLPGDPTLREEPQRPRGGAFQTSVVLLFIAGLLVVASVLVWGVFRGLGSGDEEADAPAVSPAETVDPDQGQEPSGPVEGEDEGVAGEGDDPADGDSPDEDPQDAGADDPAAPPVASGDPLPVLGISSFDPQGDGDENSELTPLVLDGDPETQWRSHTYYAPSWGGLKSGTGLVLDLGEGATDA